MRGIADLTRFERFIAGEELGAERHDTPPLADS
jgi:hypothetical protein